MKEVEVNSIGQEVKNLEKYIKKMINDGLSLKIAIDRVKCTIEIKYPPTKNPEKSHLTIVKPNETNK